MDELFGVFFRSTLTDTWDIYDFTDLYAGLDNAKKAARESAESGADIYSATVHPTIKLDDGLVKVDYKTVIARYEREWDDDDR